MSTRKADHDDGRADEARGVSRANDPLNQPQDENRSSGKEENLGRGESTVVESPTPKRSAAERCHVEEQVALKEWYDEPARWRRLVPMATGGDAGVTLSIPAVGGSFADLAARSRRQPRVHEADRRTGQVVVLVDSGNDASRRAVPTSPVGTGDATEPKAMSPPPDDSVLMLQVKSTGEVTVRIQALKIILWLMGGGGLVMLM